MGLLGGGGLLIGGGFAGVGLTIGCLEETWDGEYEDDCEDRFRFLSGCSIGYQVEGATSTSEAGSGDELVDWDV